MSSPLHDHSPADLQKIVQNHLNALMEHFECVQVLVSFPADNGGTGRFFMGAGNWYARQGMAHEFIQMDKAQTEAAEIAKVLPPSCES